MGFIGSHRKDSPKVGIYLTYMSKRLFFLIENKKLYDHAIFQVDLSLLSKVIKGKQKKNFLDPDQNFDFFGTILLITSKLLDQI